MEEGQSDPNVKPQSIVDEVFSKIKTQISKLEDVLMPVLTQVPTETKKDVEASPTLLLKELNKIYNRLCHLNGRIRL